MIPEIKELTPKKMVGIKSIMCLGNDKTSELWRSFMPRINEIKNKIGNNLFSLQNYNSKFNFSEINITSEFEKWALVEVSQYISVPDGFEKFDLQSGLYAVFHYQGSSSEAYHIFKYIFTEWLPNSEFQIDSRPHFEILGEKYKNNSSESEEEIWIPVKFKRN